ncbi:MAG: DUF63 family protein [Candidatus Hydrothermarchaeales archaeon]
MIEFIREYFINPIYQHSGYNVVNTVVYGLLLGIGIIGSERFLAQRRVKVNEKFLMAMLPFILLASVLRSLVDAEILPTSFFLITPGIFLTIFVLAVASLILGIYLKGREEYHKTPLVVGSLFLIYPLFLALTNIIILRPFFYVFIAFTISSSLALSLIHFSNLKNFKGQWIYGIFLAHFLDVSATFVGVDYFGYWEEHVFESFLISKFGTALVLFPLKFFVLLFIIYALQKLIEGEALNFWYFALFVLGLAPALRDTLTIMLVG